MKTVLAPAKLNLFLRIVGRREDGYHNIETLFQKISLSDRLTFSPSDNNEFVLESTREGRPSAPVKPEKMERNLITRAFRKMEKHVGRPLGGLRVILDKIIPIGGGLGGGSSDAAATLLALDEIFGLNINPENLHLLALQLGSDVPFFLGAPAAIGTGRGEILTPVAYDSNLWAVLALPKIHISTPQVYARYNPASPSHGGDLGGLLHALEQNDLKAALSLLFNEMEDLSFGLEPALGELRTRLEEIARRPVRMSGSGSTLFTLAASEAEAASIATQWRVSENILTTPVSFVVEHSPQ